MTILDKIYNLTHIRIEEFLADVINFYDKNDYHNSIYSYYTTYNFDYPKEAFDKYKELKSTTDFILAKLILYKGNFNTIDYWDLLEKIDDIKEKLSIIESYPRFYKVSFFKKQNQTDTYETYIMKQNETLLQISDKFNQDENDIAISNNLREEDYSIKGGTVLVLKSSKTTEYQNIEPLNSIIDICLGKNVLGKDLPNYIKFDEDEEDLVVDTPEDTFGNTLSRLFYLNKGGIPEFPDLGIDKELFQSNLGEIGELFPIIIRQLSNTLNTDDTILQFQIDDIERIEDKDAFRIHASAQNRLLEKINIVEDFSNK